ncbi:hypothetical protein CsSME_00027269 [Camellia sinensis var. sinensis]
MAKTKGICALLLRALALAATVVAAIVMVTSHEKSTLFTVTFEAKYSHTPAFKYFVIANGVTGCYTFLVFLLPSGSLLWKLVAALDIITIIIATGGTAGATIAYLMKNGNPNVIGWQPYCNLVPTYCNHIMGALAACCIGALLQFLLTMHTFHVVINPLLVKQELK